MEGIPADLTEIMEPHEVSIALTDIQNRVQDAVSIKTGFWCGKIRENIRHVMLNFRFILFNSPHF